MARQRDKLVFAPMFKYNPAEAKPVKRKRPWRAVLRFLTFGLADHGRRGERKTKE